MSIANLPQSPYFTIEQLGHGVFAAIVKPGMGAWGNAGIVDLGDFTLIIDTFLTPAAAKDLRSVAESVVNSPIRYVLNTHWHGDHTLGNQIFNDSTILATQATYNMMKENYNNLEKDAIIQAWSENLQAVSQEKELSASPQIQQALGVEIKEIQAHLDALAETHFTLPNKVITEKVYTLKGSQREVEFHCLGGGHSLSDTFVYLPKEKIIFTGDLVFVDTHPSVHAQPVEEWVSILEQINVLEIEVLAAGHGSVGTKQHVKATLDYLLDLIEAVKKHPQANDIPEEYKSWKFPHVYGWNKSALKRQMEVKNI